MEIETVHDYINREKMEERLFDILKEEAENFGHEGDEIADAVKHDLFGGDYCVLRDYVSESVNSLNRHMGEYMHRKDTGLWNGYRDIRRDYEKDCSVSKEMTFNEIVGCVDRGQRLDYTERFLGWVNGWFFDAIGPWDICFNFSEYLDDLYEEEAQTEEDAD